MTDILYKNLGHERVIVLSEIADKILQCRCIYVCQALFCALQVIQQRPYLGHSIIALLFKGHQTVLYILCYAIQLQMNFKISFKILYLVTKRGLAGLEDEEWTVFQN